MQPKPTGETSLGKMMRDIASRDNLPDTHPMVVLANQLDAVDPNGDIKQLVGAWARARRIYCEYTGEQII